MVRCWGGGSLDLTATYNWTGLHTHANHLDIYNGFDLRLFSDAGITQLGGWDAATGNIGIAPTARIFLDGASFAGDTFISEISPNRMRLFTAGLPGITIGATQDVEIEPTKRLFFDGGSDTFLSEISDGRLRFITNSATILTLSTGSVEIESGDQLFFDGGGDTYILESSPNILQLATGGSPSAFFSNGEMLLGTADPPTANWANKNSFLKAHGFIGLTGTGGGNFTDTISSEYNIDSISGSGTSVTVSLSTDFASATDYVVVVTMGNRSAGTDTPIFISNKTASSFTLQLGDGTNWTPNAGSTASFYFTATGDQ